MNVNNFLLCVNEWIKWYQEKGWKNKKKQKKNPADLGEVTEKIELEEAVKSNKKRCVQFGIRSHDMEAVGEKKQLFYKIFQQNKYTTH